MPYWYKDGPPFESQMGLATASCNSSRKRNPANMTAGFDAMWGAGYRKFMGGSNARMS